jgi:hypothetical protein
METRQRCQSTVTYAYRGVIVCYQYLCSLEWGHIESHLRHGLIEDFCGFLQFLQAPRLRHDTFLARPFQFLLSFFIDYFIYALSRDTDGVVELTIRRE